MPTLRLQTIDSSKVDAASFSETHSVNSKQCISPKGALERSTERKFAAVIFHRREKVLLVTTTQRLKNFARKNFLPTVEVSLTCNAEWKCESCGQCLDCYSGGRCPSTNRVHKRPKKKNFINRVDKKARGGMRAPTSSRAPRKLAEYYLERQSRRESISAKLETNFENFDLPMGKTQKKEGQSA